ncbi:MAG: hypothetical protein RBT49_15385 [Bacteroidales bacterium]|jgi:hypothetical protein|nr:hypothetical protein [Bacteroidales bacterium]
MKYSKSLLLLFFFLFVSSAYPQELSDDMPKIFFRNEKTIALNLNSNGWGLGYRYGSRINVFEKHIYETDFSVLKHPKEVNSSNASFLSSESFVFGKLNSVFDLRFGYGKQNELFVKRDLKSVAVRYFYSVGPSIAFRKPVYYEILYPVNDSVFGIREEKFNPAIHTAADINGKASFFKGFNEITIVPGLFAKGGFNFEFSQKENIIHALEAGVMIQAYLEDLEIMAVDDNQQFYFTLFITYRLGKVVNAQQLSPEYLKRRKNKFLFFNGLLNIQNERAYF